MTGLASASAALILGTTVACYFAAARLGEELGASGGRSRRKTPDGLMRGKTSREETLSATTGCTWHDEAGDAGVQEGQTGLVQHLGEWPGAVRERRPSASSRALSASSQPG